MRGLKQMLKVTHEYAKRAVANSGPLCYEFMHKLQFASSPQPFQPFAYFCSEHNILSSKRELKFSFKMLDFSAHILKSPCCSEHNILSSKRELKFSFQMVDLSAHILKSPCFLTVQRACFSPSSWSFMFCNLDWSRYI